MSTTEARMTPGYFSKRSRKAGEVSSLAGGVLALANIVTNHGHQYHDREHNGFHKEPFLG